MQAILALRDHPIMRARMNDHGPLQRYDRFTIAVHWLTLGLCVALFASIELRVLFAKGSAIREAFKATHFMLGLLILGLTVMRLGHRVSQSSRPPIVPAPPRWQAALSATVHALLYLMLVGMPLLGWATLSAAGKPIPFFGLEVPALMAPDKGLAKQLESLHKLIGNWTYALIALHAAAALLHHLVWRDNTLRRMGPARRAPVHAEPSARLDAPLHQQP
jgi:cytochrome b561